MKQNHRSWRNFTIKDHYQYAAAAARSPVRRCPECGSNDWTVIEGRAVCRLCGEEMRIDNQADRS